MRSTLSQFAWASVAFSVALGLGVAAWAQVEKPKEAAKPACCDANCTCACCGQEAGAKTAAQKPAPAPALKDTDVYCQVEGRTTILSLLPEGFHVQKGQLIGELDSAPLKDALTQQAIAIKTVEVAYQNTKPDRENAERALREYTDGTSRLELLKARGELALAKGELDAAEQRSKGAKERGSPSARSKVELDLQRARFKFEQAQTRLMVLENFTIPRKTTEIQSAIEKCKSNELTRKAAWELEKMKEQKLRVQIERCKLQAPIAGVVQYAKPNPGSSRNQIGEGETVRERQLIARIVPEKKE